MSFELLVLQEPIPPLPPFLPLPPSAIVDIVHAFFATIAIIAIGMPFARVLARRLERRAVTPPVPSDVVARLERIENAVDSIAIEVERISEGQRFTAKLLAERVGEPATLRRPSEHGA
jgi:hypothetical protein